MIAGLTGVMLFTAFLSGIFGMAGGMVLMGVLLAVMPLPAAMALHAVTQMASNAWRAVLWRRHINWRPVGFFLIGNLAALAVWSVFQWVPEKAVALLMLGVTPFLFRLLPVSIKPNPLVAGHAVWVHWGRSDCAGRAVPLQLPGRVCQQRRLLGGAACWF